MNEPGAVAFDAQGNTYIADSANARIRKVDSSGVISTFGPVGVQGKDYYNSVVVTPNGNLYLTWTHTEPPNGSAAFLVRVGADGSFTKVAGNGVLCSQIRTEYPDGPALNAPLCSISGMSSDSAGNVYITGGYYGVILKFAGGNLTRVAGSAVAEDSRDGNLVLNTRILSSNAVAFDGAGTMVMQQDDGFFSSSRIHAVLAPAALKLSTNRVDFQGRQSRFVTTASNVAEPLPYAISITVPWLTSNRLNGLTGEPFTLVTDPTRLARGVYTTTVEVTIATRSLTAAATDPGRRTIEITLIVLP